MNAADNGIIAAEKNYNQFHSRNCMALRPFCFFSKIGAQDQHVLQYGIALYEISV